MELTARKPACFDRRVLHLSGRKRSTTSMTLPNIAVRMASRSASLAARPTSRPTTSAAAHVEAADGPGGCLGPRRHLGHSEHRLHTEGLVEVLEQALGVRVQEDRLLAALADARRLDLRLVQRAGRQVEVLEDLVRDRELDRTGELELVAPNQLGSRGHAPDEVVLLQAEDPQAAAGHHRCCGQAVVTGTDDDCVVVRHRDRTVATPADEAGSMEPPRPAHD